MVAHVLPDLLQECIVNLHVYKLYAGYICKPFLYSLVQIILDPINLGIMNFKRLKILIMVPNA